MLNQIKPTNIFEVYESWHNRKAQLYTINLTPGKSFYGEKLIKENEIEYRTWEPFRSKLASVILKGSPNIGFRKDCTVLYLGCSYGYTASFVSDIIGKDGLIFAVDLSPRVMRDIIFLCYERKNIVPILEDANYINKLKERVCTVDIVYQDTSQRNQLDIFLKNIHLFLKEGGYALLAVKARSIDFSKDPKKIFREVREKLEKKVKIIDYKELEPFQKDHCMFICKN